MYVVLATSPAGCIRRLGGKGKALTVKKDLERKGERGGCLRRSRRTHKMHEHVAKLCALDGTF